MISEEAPGLFRIQAPLPGSPLKAVNAWLVRGPERSLLVDNGFNLPETESALLDALSALGVDRRRLDFFLTHLHSDHCGLTPRLADAESRLFCGRRDGERINAFIADADLWPRNLAALADLGFPARDVELLAACHPGRAHAAREVMDFIWTREGDELAYGLYRFRIVDVPGHTPGHQALHEPERGILICGDHILAGITPNVTRWEGVEDSLGDYLASLRKVERLDVALCLPGHRDIITDPRARIRELERHHEARLDELRAILAKKPGASAWEAAREMRWKLRGSWEGFPVAQKCFAVSEAAAHMDHLRLLGVE